MLAVEDVKVLNIKIISVLVLFSPWITAPTLSRIREIRKRGTFSVSSTLQENTKRVRKKINTTYVTGSINLNQISLILTS